MGGRGAHLAASQTRGWSADGAIYEGRKDIKHIETRYIEGNGWIRRVYKSEVLEASTDGDGNITFNYARATTDEKTAKTNKTHYVSYDLKAGAEDGKTFGIKWENVKSVSGQTYKLRDEIKEHGFVWDRDNKQWVKRKERNRNDKI